MTPFVLGIMGDSGSGKNTIADAVAALLGSARVTDLRLDDYHRFTREERMERGLTALNPMVHNVPLMQEHLKLLRRGRPIRNRSYDHADGSFGPIRMIEPREVVLVRGLMGYPTEGLRTLYDLAVFLSPEPELLFRWKLRRDVLSRGYTEAEVLKHIAQHLLDSKEFVLPQAERADLVIRSELPDLDAPDTEIRTSVLLRRRVARLARDRALVDELGPIRQESAGVEELRLSLAEGAELQEVRDWVRRIFPETFDDARLGMYLDDGGEARQSPQLTFVEGLIARAALLLIEERGAGDPGGAG
jgi:phosphoribulokinase